jgi:hypothetical protein
MDETQARNGSSAWHGGKRESWQECRHCHSVPQHSPVARLWDSVGRQCWGWRQ